MLKFVDGILRSEWRTSISKRYLNNWEPTVNLKEGLKHTCEDFKVSSPLRSAGRDESTTCVYHPSLRRTMRNSVLTLDIVYIEKYSATNVSNATMRIRSLLSTSVIA